MVKITSQGLLTILMSRVFAIKTHVRVIAYLLVSITLVGCYSKTWRLHEEKGLNMKDFPPEQLALIEQHPYAPSPEISYIKHKELGIDKGSIYIQGRRIAVRIFTPPGNIRLRTIYNGYYKPQLDFFAESGTKYHVAYVCISTRFTAETKKASGYIAILEAKSQKIIAVEVSCPDCEAIIGTPLSQSSCPILRLDPNFPRYGTPVTAYRSLCYAAERNVASARMGLGWHYERGGNYYLRQDRVLAFFWYKMASEQQGDDEYKSSAKSSLQWVKEKMEPDQIEKAELLLQNYKPGDCERQFFGAYKPFNQETNSLDDLNRDRSWFDWVTRPPPSRSRAMPDTRRILH